MVPSVRAQKYLDALLLGGMAPHTGATGAGEVPNKNFLQNDYVPKTPEFGVAIIANAAICVMDLVKPTFGKKVGGANICRPPRRHSYLARYMRGRKKKKV